MPWLFPAAHRPRSGWTLDLCLAPLGAAWRRAAAGPSLRGAIPPFLAVVALPRRRPSTPGTASDADGDFLLDPLVPFDTAFHVGLTRELVLGYPPQVPGVAGFPLGYHLGTDLVRAAALRWAGTDPFDAITRFDVTLGALALVLVLRAVIARLGAPAAGRGDSFPGRSSSRISRSSSPQTRRPTGGPTSCAGNLLLSLALANPIVPALASSSGRSSPSRATSSRRRRGHLALAAVLAAAVPFFKVFLGAHLLLGLGVAALLGPAVPAGRSSAVGLPCALATAGPRPRPGWRDGEVVLAPLDLASGDARDASACPHSTAPRSSAGAASGSPPRSACGSSAVPAPGAPCAAGGTAAASALGAMALCGWPLGLLFRVSAPEVLEGQKIVNDAAYLVEQGGPLLWIFTAIALAAFARERAAARPRGGGGASSSPSPATVQFVGEEGHDPARPHPRRRWSARWTLSSACQVRGRSCSSGRAAATRRCPWS